MRSGLFPPLDGGLGAECGAGGFQDGEARPGFQFHVAGAGGAYAHIQLFRGEADVDDFDAGEVQRGERGGGLRCGVQLFLDDCHAPGWDLRVPGEPVVHAGDADAYFLREFLTGYPVFLQPPLDFLDVHGFMVPRFFRAVKRIFHFLEKKFQENGNFC